MNLHTKSRIETITRASRRIGHKISKRARSLSRTDTTLLSVAVLCILGLAAYAYQRQHRNHLDRLVDSFDPMRPRGF